MTTACRRPDDPPSPTKDVLVGIGRQALRHGDWRRVELLTALIREGGLTHEWPVCQSQSPVPQGVSLPDLWGL
jgi:hypothetical protein